MKKGSSWWGGGFGGETLRSLGSSTRKYTVNEGPGMREGGVLIQPMPGDRVMASPKGFLKQGRLGAHEVGLLRPRSGSCLLFRVQTGFVSSRGSCRRPEAEIGHNPTEIQPPGQLC